MTVTINETFNTINDNSADKLKQPSSNAAERPRKTAAEKAKEIEEREQQGRICFCLPANVDCAATRWTIFRFIGLCLIAILILCLVYGIKSSESSSSHEDLESVYAVGDPIYARDLWMIIEVPSDDRGRRTKLGRLMADHVCSAIRAAQAVGWTPLVVGGRSSCCRHRCRHLHPIDLERMNHTLSLFMWYNRNDIRSAMRTAAYLAAIKKGANFIFQANPEVFYTADVSPKVYKAELEYQLRKMTLGISVGLVKENPTEKYHFDPYAHFSPEHEARRRRTLNIDTSDEDIIHRYKICEIRPPSIEKFLDQDGYSLDLAAPPLTLPGEISAPFDSRNTMFGREALWSLLVLPVNGARITRENYVIRSILAQAVLAEIGGSSKFTVAKTTTIDNAKELANFSPKVDAILDFVENWNCGTGSALICLNGLVKQLIDNGILDQEMGQIVDMWTNDLIHVGYRDITTVKKDKNLHSPCIGEDALFGVYFHPAVKYKQRPRSGKSFEGKPLSTTQLNRQIAAKSIQRLCPTVDVHQAMRTTCHDNNACNNHENILLIVTFNDKQYNSIPLFEVIYRHHFQNILYCGEPDELVDQYMEQYNGIQSTYFNFLPAHSKTGYECLLGAIEMGFNVDGYMVVTHDTLINSWNFEHLNLNSIWHGNQHVQNITASNINTIDPNNKKIMKSTKGILKALEFLEEVLLKTSSKDLLEKHQEQQQHIGSRRKRSPDGSEQTESFEANSGISATGMMDETDKMMALDETMPHDEMMEHDEMMAQDMESKSVSESNDTAPLSLENNWHISLFGEIIPDTGILVDSEDVQLTPNRDHQEFLPGDEKAFTNETKESLEASRNVTELLFHPANFLHEGQTVNLDEAESEDDSSHFDHMVYSIRTIFKSINEKLNFWQSLINNGNVRRPVGGTLQKDFDGFQCDVSTNSEICHLVSDFFKILESNEGSDFRLFYDDLPIYYVPSRFKDKLYLMANLFTKYHVADELAFPLLLRGLAPESEWANLDMAEVPDPVQAARPEIDQPQDLLLLSVDDERAATLENLDSSHYIHPVDMTKVLKNEAMRDIICRNF